MGGFADIAIHYWGASDSGGDPSNLSINIDNIGGDQLMGVDLDVEYSTRDNDTGGDDDLVEAFLGVLELASTRATVEEVMGLLECEPIRDRFELSTRNIETLEKWVVESGIRWGIDSEHRGELGQPAFENNT